MSKAKKIMTVVLASVMSVSMLGACGSNGGSAANDKGHVYFLNSKPEIADQLKSVAKEYSQKTGVQVDVQTAAAGTLDSTLQSELAKSNAPTMFSVAGFDEFAKHQSYMAPLENTDLFKLLTKDGKANADKVNGHYYTLPYAAEWYGIIYNKKIVNNYASKDYAIIKSDKDITDYKTMVAVMNDIQAHKADLGLDAAIATPGLDVSGEWRFTGHMIRLPMSYEYEANNTTFEPKLKGTYLPNFKNLWDVYIKDQPTQTSLLSSKTLEDATSEFSLGKVAFYPNGVWAYGQIKGNKVADKDLGMLPYFMGIPGEEKYGPASVYDAQWCINKHDSAQDKKASLDFIKWLVTNKDGKKVLSKDMGFSVPFSTFKDADQAENPLTIAAKSYTAQGKKFVRSFPVPSQQWQDGIAGALAEYSQGTKEWSAVNNAIIDGWQKEWGAAKSSLGMLPDQEPFSD